jgi:hypothetical protein
MPYGKAVTRTMTAEPKPPAPEDEGPVLSTDDVEIKDGESTGADAEEILVLDEDEPI